MTESAPYILEDQIGFLLRTANQRHRSIFNREVANAIAPAQFSTLAKLYELGPVSQNQLGRLIALDSATIKGVVNRLVEAGYVNSECSESDARLRMIDLTDQGRKRIRDLLPVAARITEATLAPLSEREAVTLHKLLRKISG
jgi:DNA-binding MarR family transcriptional regulator